MNKNTVLVSLATYVVATAVLLGGAGAFGLIPGDGKDGANGQDGAAGVNGTNGIDGKDASLNVYVIKKYSAASKYNASKATCRSGDTLIGGGALINDYGNYVMMVESYPSGNSWVAKGVPINDGSSRGSIEVYAVCQDNP
jgi:hypothetical protein